MNEVSLKLQLSIFRVHFCYKHSLALRVNETARYPAIQWIDCFSHCPSMVASLHRRGNGKKIVEKKMLVQVRAVARRSAHVDIRSVFFSQRSRFRLVVAPAANVEMVGR